MPEKTLTEFVELLGFELAPWQRDIIAKCENDPSFKIKTPSTRVRLSRLNLKTLADYDREINAARHRKDGTVKETQNAKRDFVHELLGKSSKRR